MSLESNLPTFASKNPQHEMWVACQKSNGQVLAFCEVDNREKDFLDNATKPYMCNLAVHLDHRGKGLAKEMIRQCEDTADLWKEEKLFLKVREHNEPAVQLYKTMGYDVVATQTDQKTDDTLLVMKRAWEWRPLIMNTAEEEEGIAVADDSSSRLDAAANMTLKQ
jgi:ribosomal protein S18 acetylase RimI-like enzyme